MIFKLIFSQKYFVSQASYSPLCDESREDIILKLVSFPRLALFALHLPPFDPRSARGRTFGIGHRNAILQFVPVCKQSPTISVHIENAPYIPAVRG